MIWFLRRGNAAEEARKRSKAGGAQQSQQSSSSDDWSMNPANPMSSTLNSMHAAGNSPSNDQVPSPDCPPSMTAAITIPAPVALRMEGIRAETRVAGVGVALTAVGAVTDRNLFG
jgi:hypothetical protein